MHNEVLKYLNLEIIQSVKSVLLVTLELFIDSVYKTATWYLGFKYKKSMHFL